MRHRLRGPLLRPLRALELCGDGYVQCCSSEAGEQEKDEEDEGCLGDQREERDEKKRTEKERVLPHV